MSIRKKLVKTAVIVPLTAIAIMVTAHVAMMGATPKPPKSEFGFGPRVSANRHYSVTIEESAPYKTGKLIGTVIRVEQAAGKLVDDAEISVDGGMPQHGHGLPTRPRVTKSLGGGRYQVEGLKFNMGGWWELKFTITAGATSDSVTFNLDL